MPTQGPVSRRAVSCVSRHIPHLELELEHDRHRHDGGERGEGDPDARGAAVESAATPAAVASIRVRSGRRRSSSRGVIIGGSEQRPGQEEAADQHGREQADGAVRVTLSARVGGHSRGDHGRGPDPDEDRGAGSSLLPRQHQVEVWRQQAVRRGSCPPRRSRPAARPHTARWAAAPGAGGRRQGASDTARGRRPGTRRAATGTSRSWPSPTVTSTALAAPASCSRLRAACRVNCQHRAR